jgi:hypothetical protein
MRWITDVQYNPDKPEQRVQALKEAEALAALLLEAGFKTEIAEVERTPDPAGGYVFGDCGFFRLLIDEELLKKAQTHLRQINWSEKEMWKRVAAAICSCHQTGPSAKHFKPLGVDPTDGRFAEVSYRFCEHCSRRWLFYQFEIEGFSRSGRWYTGLFPYEEPYRVGTDPKPEEAAGLFAAMPWYVYGGSYFGHAGERGSGPIS